MIMAEYSETSERMFSKEEGTDSNAIVRALGKDANSYPFTVLEAKVLANGDISVTLADDKEVILTIKEKL